MAEEIGLRDPKWFYDGVPCPIVKEHGAKPNADEMTVAKTLSSAGFRTVFIPESKEKFVKSPDAKLNGVVWEFKIPTSFNKKTIKNQFKKSLGKGTSRLLIANHANHADASAMLDDIRKILNSNEFSEIDEVLFAGFDGQLVRVKR